VPTVSEVSLADCGHILRLPVDDPQSVQVTPILRGELRNERRLPDRSETVNPVQSGQTRMECVHEDKVPFPVHGDFVDVYIAGKMDRAGDKLSVKG